MTPLGVLSVASEIFPLVKTGGLADVVGALPAALAEHDIAVRTLIPGYPAVISAIATAQPVLTIPDLFGGPARILAGRAANLDLLVLDAPHFFARSGNPYLAPNGRDWPDNALRFAALARAAADIGGGAISSFRPNIVHAHDWQAALAPAYLHYRGSKRPGTVMTVHNLAFPGKAARANLARLGLPPSSFAIDGVEFYGDISLLKAGLQFADRITTVSPTYAAEIQTTEAGMGFEGLLQARSNILSGILNGLDTTTWNPETDNLIAARYTRTTLTKRTANKTALQSRLGLAPDPAAPLFAVVSRLTWQKGMDLLLAALPTILAEGAQLAILGAGEPELETALRARATAHPTSIACVIGYDEALAHRFQAGADALLVPSRFEPCGLTQLCALRYGAIPVVARVGGLADTVIDANPAALTAGAATGIQFNPVTTETLHLAITRTLALYRTPTIWRTLQTNAMSANLSWQASAQHYANLYRELVAVPRV